VRPARRTSRTSARASRPIDLCPDRERHPRRTLPRDAGEAIERGEAAGGLGGAEGRDHRETKACCLLEPAGRDGSIQLAAEGRVVGEQLQLRALDGRECGVGRRLLGVVVRRALA
jgi:hypothetical protein